MTSRTDSLRWSRHWRVGRRHIGLALYRRMEDPLPLWAERHYFDLWTIRSA